jgi:hypothetical protein
MPDDAVKPTAESLEGLLKTGQIAEFKDVLSTQVWSNMEWHEADAMIRQLGKLNECDRTTRPDLPRIELYDEHYRPEAGVLAVVLTTPDHAAGAGKGHSEIVAGQIPLNPEIVNPNALSSVRPLWDQTTSTPIIPRRHEHILPPPPLVQPGPGCAQG